MKVSKKGREKTNESVEERKGKFANDFFKPMIFLLIIN